MTKKTRPQMHSTKSGKRVWVRVITVGQNFGELGQVMIGRRVLAEADETRPLGFRASAESDALALLADL